MRRITLFLLLLIACSSEKPEIKAKKLLETGKLKEAEAILLESDTPSVLSRILLGEVYTRMGKLDRALTAFKSAGYNLKKDEKNFLSTGLLELARKAQEQNYYLIAREAYERLLEVDPDADIGDGLKFLADYYFRLGDKRKALSYYEMYLNRGGDFEGIATNYAQCLLAVGDYRKLAEYYDELRKIREADTDWILQEGLYKLAEQLYEEEKYDSALLYLKKLLGLRTNDIYTDRANLLMGRVYEALYDTLNAIRAYSDYLRSPRKKGSQADEVRQRLKALTR
ncbi:MAG: hypothetical protein J7K11_08405 [Candidatus Hydrothermae bacterium]|nr:hypothetical protein [Candidatus Hydrothermae bacterium]